VTEAVLLNVKRATDYSQPIVVSPESVGFHMGIIAVTSAANHDRILFGREWLKTKNLAEEVLIIGSTLAAARLADWAFKQSQIARYTNYPRSLRF
jgi:hypothetical protein